MKRILCILIALVFLSGCALSTIKSPKKGAVEEPKPVRKTAVEKVKEVFKPQPKPKREEKEVVLPEDIK